MTFHAPTPSDAPEPRSSLVLYQAEDGRTRIQCRRQVAREIEHFSGGAW